MQSQPSFSSLGLSAPVLEAVKAEGYETPTPVQALAIPIVLAGKDLKASAKTGTGKTAAFALPIIQTIAERGERAEAGKPLALVLVPTRELAAQVGESFNAYGARTDLRAAVAYGGVGKAPQVAALAEGAEVLVATPGRLLDLAADGAVDLGRVRFFVLDEADRMLDMGFLPDMRRVFKLIPEERQTLLFSATMTDEIKDIASGILRSPESIAVDPPAAPADGIEQRVYYVEKERKRGLLIRLLAEGDLDRALVFTRTRHLANRLSRHLNAAGFPSEALHSDKSQSHRLRSLAAFKDGKLRVLVATDLAARGLDIDELPHVVNLDVPNEPETYVHRIGRTARAGASGTALSFCSPEERTFMADIERLLGRKVEELPVPEGLPFPPAREARQEREDDADGEADGRTAAEGPSSAAGPGTPEGAAGDGQREGGKSRSSRRRRAKKRAQEAAGGQNAADAPVAERGPKKQAQDGRKPVDGQRKGNTRNDEKRRDADRPRGDQGPKDRGRGPKPAGQGPRPSRFDREQRPDRGRDGRRPDGQRGGYDRQRDQRGGQKEPRKPLSDEEAWLKAQRDLNQPGIRPPGD